MHRWTTIFSVSLVLLLCAVPAGARSYHHKRARSGTPGVFDYYVLSLSWSPQHCANQFPGPKDPQCGSYRRYGFVVHGLWPQYENGFPQSCAPGGGLDQATVNSVLDIMPSPPLVRHEWATHGTCSGMDAATYFTKVRAAYSGLKIPAPYQQPSSAFHVAPRQIKQEFEHENPGVRSDDLAVLCSGKYLQEVRVCLDKNLRARGCGRDVRDGCRDDMITVRPIR